MDDHLVCPLACRSALSGLALVFGHGLVFVAHFAGVEAYTYLDDGDTEGPSRRCGMRIHPVEALVEMTRASLSLCRDLHYSQAEVLAVVEACREEEGEVARNRVCCLDVGST